MTEEEVKDLLKEASEKIKDDFIPSMTNLLMNVFQYGINKGSELGMKVASDASKSKSQSLIKWKTGRPEEYGLYIVTLDYGCVATDEWYMFSDGDDWHYLGNHVTAWCKLDDIEAYKGG